MKMISIRGRTIAVLTRLFIAFNMPGKRQLWITWGWGRFEVRVDQ